MVVRQLAPPGLRSSIPVLSSSEMSRRMVCDDTPSSSASDSMETYPCRITA